MFDALQILGNMVAAQYEPLKDSVRIYADSPPEETGGASNPSVYAVVNVQENERQYNIQGGGGRYMVDWTLRVYGTREAVVKAARELPMAVTAPYREVVDAEENLAVTVLYSHLNMAGGLGRSASPEGVAAQVLRFTSEMAAI